jgi:hypothetical protein
MNHPGNTARSFVVRHCGALENWCGSVPLYFRFRDCQTTLFRRKRLNISEIRWRGVFSLLIHGLSIRGIRMQVKVSLRYSSIKMT